MAYAVADVSDQGVLYFSSAANSGNKTSGTSSTWEGDFSALGSVTGVGPSHNWGGTNFNKVTNANAGTSKDRVNLFWSDPLGNATNDYDIYVSDDAGNILRTSNNAQGDGGVDPYEGLATINAGENILVVLDSGSGRFLHLDVGRGRITYNTQGSTRGHNASNAINAFSVAATPVSKSPAPGVFVGGSVNPVETFSSDGPRHLFFDENGAAITPGNVSSTGGAIFSKPDITAADGVSNSGAYAPSAGLNPFFGTSAAAPHAAAIAALLKSFNPTFTAGEIRDFLQNSALDTMATGYDNDSGYGIIMADRAIAAAKASLDHTAPTVTVSTPANNAALTAFTSITGTANDGASSSGIVGNQVSFTLRHIPTGDYWNGTGWTATQDYAHRADQ